MNEVQLLMNLNRKVTLLGLGEELDEREIELARNAAKEVSKTGYFKFTEGNSNVEFFKELQQFSNKFRNL